MAEMAKERLVLKIGQIISQETNVDFDAQRKKCLDNFVDSILGSSTIKDKQECFDMGSQTDDGIHISRDEFRELKTGFESVERNLIDLKQSVAQLLLKEIKHDADFNQNAAALVNVQK